MSNKQPRKKRRLDSEEGPSRVVPPECIPLVNPNQVVKSSKDPNRGLYPRNKKSRKSMGNVITSFTKASDLINSAKAKQVKTSIETVDVESSDSDNDFYTPKRSRKSDSVIIPKSKHFNSRLCSSAPGDVKKSGPTRSLRNRNLVFSAAAASSNKISNYFKCLPRIKQKTNDSPTVNDDSLPGPSSADTSNISENKFSKNKNEDFFEKIRNCYGLFGDNSSEEFDEEKPNYFEKLPDHILETILCQIPMLDMLNCRRVCRAWDVVITNSKFMDWKRLYYRIKMKDQRALVYIKQEAVKCGLKAVEDAFSVIIKYMGEGFRRKPSSDMYQILIKNKLASNAELVLIERFPDLSTKESKPWSIFAMAILLSETVWDVYNLYRSLFKSYSECSVHDVTNALYCAAAFLLYFRNTFHLNYGLHYRVYYVIYMIENTLPAKDANGIQTLRIPKGLPGQQSIHSFCDSTSSHLTYEQIRILNHCIQPKQVIKIVALAGTGKTTTLIHLAQLYPQVKFLNVMYNKAICEEAKKYFPSNVTCKTAHSLAYGPEGAKLRYKLASKIKPHDIVTLLKHKEGSSLHTFSYAKCVLNTIEAFVYSADEEITLEHVPLVSRSASNHNLSENDRLRVQKDAVVIWSLMKDRNDKSVKITHDVYLKLYQLSKPNLSQYHCIMVDEAQDCNPAILHVLLRQNLPVILVGDPNQQIYGFRGAKNALQNVFATHTYHLTKSFRFGPEIAYIASSCLENLKKVTTNTLIGNEKQSYVNGKVVGQYAIISRTNVTLFNEAVRLCCQKRIKDHEPSIINGAFVGGISSYGFQQLLDICKLAKFHNDPDYEIKDKFISKFKTYEELFNYAKNADDCDLLSKVELIRMYTYDIPNYVKTIKEKCSHPMQLANVIFSTAHKSKGLEFDTVCLTDDYPIVNWSLNRRRTTTSGSEEEEYNIIYVAMTRAKTSLLLPEKLYRVFLSSNEKFEYPLLSKDIAANGEEVKCINCSEMFKPHTVLVLYRREMILANGRKIQGGSLCMKCRTDPKVRTRVEVDPVIMYLDPTDDYAHRSMACLVGPLPNDPPICHSSFPPFQEMDVVYIINIHV